MMVRHASYLRILTGLMALPLVWGCARTDVAGGTSVSPAATTPPAVAPANAPVRIRLIESALSVGDALVIEVIPRSPAARVDPEEFEFWLLRDGAGARRIWPVVPPSGVSSPPPAAGARKLVFTRATLDPGEYRIAAAYRTADGAPGNGRAQAWTAAEGLSVGETASVERDGLGLITRGAAERIARQAAAAPPEAPCASRLLDSPYGLKVWEVRVGSDAAAAGTIFVNPYLGSIHTMPISEEEKISG